MDLVWRKLVVEEGNLLVHMVALRKLPGPTSDRHHPGSRLSVRDAGRRDRMRWSGRVCCATGHDRWQRPDSSPLFGRAEDLDAVESLLREHPIVTIVGAGGIGKTRIALAAAAAPRVESPHGCWWATASTLRTTSLD